MHVNGFAHRDIKLENICVGTDNLIRVADLGYLTKVSEEVQAPRMMGTIDYMALELFHPSYSIPSSNLIKTDVYSLGVLIFALVAKMFPYHQYNQDDPHHPKNKRIILVYNNEWDAYWETYNNLHFDSDFKELIENMLRSDPN